MIDTEFVVRTSTIPGLRENGCVPHQNRLKYVQIRVGAEEKDWEGSFQVATLPNAAQK